MHECEDINANSLLEESIRAYIHKGIKETYGLNLLEFLELPLDIIELLFDINSELQVKKTNVLNNLEKEFEKK